MAEIEILTERLQLNRLVAEDESAMFVYRSDPEVCRYQSFEPGEPADVREFIAKVAPVEFDTPGTWFQFALRERVTNALAGDVGVHFTDDDFRQVEIGFTLAPAFQGRGLATEAVAGVLEHLFSVLKKHRVFASVDPRNHASVKLLERIGMRQEAHFRKSLWFKGEWADDLVYAVLRSEWSQAKGEDAPS